MRSTNGDWENLKDDFCHSFFYWSHFSSVCSDLLAFEQLKEKSISASWARISCLLAARPSVSIPNDIALYIFHAGLDIDAAMNLNFATACSFAHRTPIERKVILDHMKKVSLSFQR